jgi:hypothetical protein
MIPITPRFEVSIFYHQFSPARKSADAVLDNGLICLVLCNFTNLQFQALTKIGPLFPHSELSNTLSNMPSLHTPCTSHSSILGGERCSTGVEAWSTCFGVAPACRNMGLPWPNTIAPFPPAARLDNAAASYTAPPLLLFLFQGFMIDVKARAGCMSSLTQLVCTPATTLNS